MRLRLGVSWPRRQSKLRRKSPLVTPSSNTPKPPLTLMVRRSLCCRPCIAAGRSEGFDSPRREYFLYSSWYRSIRSPCGALDSICGKLGSPRKAARLLSHEIRIIHQLSRHARLLFHVGHRFATYAVTTLEVRLIVGEEDSTPRKSMLL